MKKTFLKIFKIFLITALPLLLSGCIGLGLGYAYSSEIQVQGCDGKTKEQIIVENTGRSLDIDEDSISYELAMENKERFRGIVPFVIIPIPLVLPVGSNYYTYEFEDGKCVKEYYDDTYWDGGLCGYYGEWGCRTW